MLYFSSFHAIIKNIMKRSLEQYIKEISGLEVSLSHPEHATHGDLSSPVAMRLAKERRVPPMVIARELADKIRRDDKDRRFSRIEEATPGFLNFWVADSCKQEELLTILKAKGAYGRNFLSKDKRKKIQIEYISANPTGPLTIANGRGGFLGHVLSNVLEAAGHKVEREYYVNDTGNQVLTLGKSILAALGLMPEEEKFYKGEYVKIWARKNKSKVKRLARSPLVLGQLAARDFFAATRRAIEKKAKIKFDRYTSEEKNIHGRKYPEKALKIFKNTGKAFEKDGAIWLKTTDFGDDKDRVLVTRDNFPTYFLADAGHYLETKERGFERKINILGPDHYGYVARIQAAAELVGFGDSQIIVTQAVRLLRDGVEAKMSKRKGEFITFEEMVDEVGADAARFFFLLITPTTHMDFDLSLAKEHSMKNPVYYTQYAYVRANSILKKAGKAKKVEDFEKLMLPQEVELISELLKFSDILADTAEDYEVSRLPRYATELARAFHNFYEHARIIGVNKEVASARLALVRTSVIIFENLFDIMEIAKPKKM